jgi:pilus assembly protein CpaC
MTTRLIVASACALLTTGLFASRSAVAQPKIRFHADAQEQIRLEVGQTRLIHASTKIIRISVADPNVVDVQVVTPLQVLVTAKSVGYTHLIMWGEDEVPVVIAVSCARNLDQLRTQLKELFPSESVEVDSAGELVVLSGKVSDLRLPARAAEVAKLYSEQLANLIEVTGDQQVQLDVRFAEVSRSGLRKLGMNFLWQDDARGHVGGQAMSGTQVGEYLRDPRGNLHIPGTGGAGQPPFVAAPSSSDAFNLFFATGLSDFPFSTILSILSQEGLAKLLAEPTLVALSGQEAEFHAGGEIPILTAQQLGTVNIDYKKFGVRLKFSPTVLGKRTISLKLSVEVSEPDPSNGVVVSGFQIPGFRARSSDTTVRIKDGQSFAVAGLLSDDVRSTVNKVPLLGDLPILGSLFRSTAYQRQETELLVVVTAHLVQPLAPDEVPTLPGQDQITDPNDFELFLLGRVEPKRRRRARIRPTAGRGGNDDKPTSSIGPAGPLGFIRND